VLFYLSTFSLGNQNLTKYKASVQIPLKNWVFIMITGRIELFSQIIMSLPHSVVIFGKKVPGKTAPYRASFGGITAECSMVLPLFLFFCINYISVLSIFSIHSSVEAALHQEVSQAAVRSYALHCSTKAAGAYEIADSSAAISSIGICNQVKRRAGTAYLDRSLIVGGADGIKQAFNILENNGEDVIDVTLSYSVSPIIKLLGFPDMKLCNRCCMKAWTGYDINNFISQKKDMAAEEMVYVAKEGVVYHKDATCSYLNPSISPVNISQVNAKRNKWGEKYYPCEVCGKTCEGNIYITNHGNRYHSSVFCSGIKRDVRRIPLSEAGGLGPCSRCG